MSDAASSLRPPALPGQPELKAVAGLFVAESLLLAVVVAAHVPWAVWLAGHLGIVGWFAYDSWKTHAAQRDVSARALEIVTVLAGGPAGALAMMVSLWIWSRQRVRRDLLDAWYERIALAGDIDEVKQLADTVAMGRAVGTGAEPPRSFDDVMASGTLAERQAALGLIARRFSTDYAPALRSALTTSEPMVRVQAAAVATRVRAGLKSDIRAALDQAQKALQPDAQTCAALIARFRALIGTGMIEDDDRASAEVEIVRLAGLCAGQTPPADRQAREQLESELLRLGDFAGFRAIRAAASAGAA